MDSTQFVIIGKIGKPKGLKGEFFFHFYDDDVGDILQCSNFHYKKEDSFVKLPKIHFKISGKSIVGQFDRINDINKIDGYINNEVYIHKDSLPQTEENEYFYFDLIGCYCYYKDKEIGIVQDIRNHGSCDLFEIVEEKNTLFLPFLMKHIKLISIESKEIHFKDIEGFM